MTLGQYLKELRRQRHLTQRQLAEQIGVDFSYLSKIENDRLEHTPSLKTLQDLAKALEVDELELMELADKVPPVLKAIARDKDAMRFFRRATGNTFTDFVNLVRVNRACQLLMETDRQVTRICYEVGFNNVANFNRRFREIKGMTPSEFRHQAEHRFGRIL